jgi:hypothetical protein
MRAIVDEVRPEACYAQNWVRGVQAHLAADYADVLLPEFYQKTDLVPLGMKMRLTKAYFKDRPIWGNVRHGVRHDARHFPVGPTCMLLMDCIANHAAPLMLDLCAMDYDTIGVDQLASTFDDMGKVQDALAHAEPLRYAALVHSTASHLADMDRFESAFEGIYRLLFERHMPLEIITEEAVAQGALQHYRVAILADAYALEETTIQAICDAAIQGVGILATYTSGFANAQGGLHDKPALCDLLGIEIQSVRALDSQPFSKPEPLREVSGLDGAPFHYASARGDHPITQTIADERLFPFFGGYVACRPINGAEAVAHIHLPDLERLAAPAVNRRGLFPLREPAWPLLVTREMEKQRTAYVCAQVEAESGRAHAPEFDDLLINTVQWLAGPSPITTTDCPRSVEVRVSHDAVNRFFVILLVNLTTNPLVPSSAGPAVVRYVTPLKGLAMHLDTPTSATRVYSVLNGNPTFSSTETGMRIQLPHLDLYECLIVEYSD